VRDQNSLSILSAGVRVSMPLLKVKFLPIVL